MTKNVNNLSEWIDIQHLHSENIEQYLQVLGNLTEVKTDLETAKKVFRKDIATNPLHYIFIAIDKRKKTDEQVVASCTLLIEPKLIGFADRVGHIEDVSVKKDCQGMGIGSMIVDFVTKFGFEKMKCTKIELDCSDSTVPFYEKLGYTYNGIMMNILEK